MYVKNHKSHLTASQQTAAKRNQRKLVNPENVLLHSLSKGRHLIQSILNTDKHVLNGVQFIHKAFGL